MVKYILFCFVVIQILLVQAKTYEEVVQDLEPIFKDLQDTLTEQEKVGRESETKILQTVRQYVYNARAQLQSRIETILVYIRDMIQTIIVENGMVNQLDVIEHCIAKKNTDSGTLHSYALSGAEVCVRLGNKNIDYSSKTIMIPLYNKQRITHQSINAVKKDCNTENAAQALICITNELIGKWKPEVARLEAELKIALDRVQTSTTYISANADNCNSIVFERMDYDKKPIVDNFKKCVVEAASSLNKLY